MSLSTSSTMLTGLSLNHRLSRLLSASLEYISAVSTQYRERLRLRLLRLRSRLEQKSSLLWTFILRFLFTAVSPRHRPSRPPSVLASTHCLLCSNSPGYLRFVRATGRESVIDSSLTTCHNIVLVLDLAGGNPRPTVLTLKFSEPDQPGFRGKDG